MLDAPVVPNVPRLMRIIHAALLGGSTVAGIVLAIVRSVAALPPFAGGPMLGYGISGAALLLLAAATLGVRPRLPERQPGQAADAYWTPANTRLSAIFLWAGIEGAGLFSWVGYFLTGNLADAVTGVIALLVLYSCRPSTIEGERAA